jgi:hypothetical protein
MLIASTEHLRAAGYVAAAQHSPGTFTHDPAGNDPELDPDRPADPPTRAIEKPVMRHGKRDGTDAPKPMPERLSHQNRAKQTDNANENGTLNTKGIRYALVLPEKLSGQLLTKHSIPGSRRRL